MAFQIIEERLTQDTANYLVAQIVEQLDVLSEEYADRHRTFYVSDLASIGKSARPLSQQLMQLGVPQNDILDTVKMYLEAAANAYEHGHQKDPTKPIRVDFAVGKEGVMVGVHDQGNGFSHAPTGSYTSNGSQRGNGYGAWIREGIAYRDAHGFHVICVRFFEEPLKIESKTLYDEAKSTA